jgi:DNA-binding transcriptional regulator GbsR (MarR family)
MLDRKRGSSVEWHRLRVADAWGTMSAAWGVPPAVARAHGYLLACRQAMTERQVREALGLSHRAASMALDRTVELGLAVRTEGHRIGARGPVGAAYRVVDDDWAWVGRVIAERRTTELDPIAPLVRQLAVDVAEDLRARPGESSLAELGSWLDRFHASLRKLDHAVTLVPALEPRDLETLVAVAASIPETSFVRLVRLLGGLAPDDIAGFADALARLPPKTVRPAIRALAALGAAGGRGGRGGGGRGGRDGAGHKGHKKGKDSKDGR